MLLRTIRQTHAAEWLHLAERSLAETGGNVALAPDDVRCIATELGTRRRENSDNDAALQITTMPAGVVMTSDFLYVTEIFSRHTLLTPLDRLGVVMPTTLYSIAYF